MNDLAATPAAHAADRREIAFLERIDERLLWLACWTIHTANHLRDKRDGLKVGGHQASCASMSTLMAVLYFSVLRPEDRVAVKPHASPLFHAAQYLFGRQTQDQLKRFRALGGAQSYPSRTKDKDDVDFSTGSVGLGVAITAFASLVQDYVAARDPVGLGPMGRMISLLGDAELDEGNIYEALIEAAKHDIRNTWWIVDYNRQSLDATTPDRMFARHAEIFEACGWRVETLKYGKRLRAAFARPGGAALRAWLEACPNDLYAALSFEGGAAWRAQLLGDLESAPGAAELLSTYDDDDALAALMTNLGGHCVETLLEAFHGVRDDAPRFFIAYTIKGWRLPFQGHKDNHAGLMNPGQIEALRVKLGVPEGKEWGGFTGLSTAETEDLQNFIAACPYAARESGRRSTPVLPPPPRAAFPRPEGAVQSTQAAFGKILHDLARREDAFADALVTLSPDVTVSTNLGGFVNRRGLFARTPRADLFKARKLQSPQTWARGPDGQHVELGIAENNLFLALGAFGLAHSLFGRRLLPIGTLYDPFIARGLDALNYAVYQDARFLLVATPSGLALAPEGGAHQSINTPLIGMGQPGLDAYEPAFADELSVLMQHAFAHIQAEDGASVYLRLSTRPIAQPVRADAAWEAAAVAGGYWHVPPAPGARLAIVYSGMVAPEAMAAHAEIAAEAPGVGLLAVTSPDLLHRGWTASTRSRWTGEPAPSWTETLLAPLAPDAGLVTVLDGSPAALSWLGAVRGQRVRPLGVERFGQTGDIDDLYRVYRLDADAILDAAADLLA